MSFDAIAATFLFVMVAVFGVIYALNFFAGDVGQALENDANAISNHLIDELSVESDVTGQVEIDEDTFIQYIDRSQTEYALIKRELGVRKDFCVFLENETGGLITIVIGNSTSLEVRRAAFGSGEVVFSNGTSTFSCG